MGPLICSEFPLVMTITSTGRRYNNLVSNSCRLISSLKLSNITSPINGCTATIANCFSETSLIQTIYSGTSDDDDDDDDKPSQLPWYFHSIHHQDMLP